MHPMLLGGHPMHPMMLMGGHPIFHRPQPRMQIILTPGGPIFFP